MQGRCCPGASQTVLTRTRLPAKIAASLLFGKPLISALSIGTAGFVLETGDSGDGRTSQAEPSLSLANLFAIPPGTLVLVPTWAIWPNAARMVSRSQRCAGSASSMTCQSIRAITGAATGDGGDDIEVLRGQVQRRGRRPGIDLFRPPRTDDRAGQRQRPGNRLP